MVGVEIGEIIGVFFLLCCSGEVERGSVVIVLALELSIIAVVVKSLGASVSPPSVEALVVGIAKGFAAFAKKRFMKELFLRSNQLWKGCVWLQGVTAVSLLQYGQ